MGTGAARLSAGEPATGGQAYGEIKRMFVRPDRRGQRVGERLLQALEAEQGRQGLSLSLRESLIAGRLDVALLFDPAPTPLLSCDILQREPLVLACYYEGPARSSDWVRPQDEAVLAEVARLAAAALT